MLADRAFAPTQLVESNDKGEVPSPSRVSCESKGPEFGNRRGDYEIAASPSPQFRVSGIRAPRGQRNYRRSRGPKSAGGMFARGWHIVPQAPSIESQAGCNGRGDRHEKAGNPARGAGFDAGLLRRRLRTQGK